MNIGQVSAVFLVMIFLVTSCARVPPKTSLTLERPIPVETQFNSLSTYVQVNIQARGKNESFDAALLLQRPNQLRIEIMNDLGEIRAQLIADGEQILWYDGNKEKYSTLTQQPNSLKKILKLPISVEEFIQQMLLPISVPSTSLRYSVAHDRYQSHNGKLYPQEMKWEFRKPKVFMTLQLSHIELNKNLNPQKFNTSLSSNAELGKIR